MVKTVQKGEEKALKDAWDTLTDAEKAVLDRASQTRQGARLAREMLAARARAAGKSRSRQLDNARRTLVGARVPRSLALAVRECADIRGVSVYRFVVDVLERSCENILGFDWKKG